ncbi:MAG: hypothetical protein NWQ46_11440, partial [Spirosomaceae bacterium]|nr:hypothetical protein [Spirosomataceae bacterium]
MLMNFTQVHSETRNNPEVLTTGRNSEPNRSEAVGLTKSLGFAPQILATKEQHIIYRQSTGTGIPESLTVVNGKTIGNSSLNAITEPIEKHTQVNSQTQNPKDMGFKSLQKPLFKYVASMLFILMTFMTAFGQLPTVDLKLSKNIDNSQPQAGDLVKFTMTLQNEGSTTATQIVVEDMFPAAGLQYGSGVTQSGSWSYNNTTGTGAWTIPSLAAGQTVRLEVTATVKTTAMGVFFNVAEVKSVNEEDYDSVPGNKKLYEDDIATACFSVPILWTVGDEYNVSIPPMYVGVANTKWMRNDVAVTSATTQASVLADGSLAITGPGSYTFTADLSSCNATGCCALQIIDATDFDLALQKLTAATSVTPGQNVTFDIKVINQGNVNATNIMVVDYIPTGFSLNDPNWDLVAGIARLKTPIASILAGQDATVKIILKVNDNLAGGTRLDNFAEISDARDPNGNVIEDKDSTPDDISDNDGVAKNDEINENGKQGGDEDDHDIASVTVVDRPIYDIALVKRTNQKKVMLGETVTFNIEVINQGTESVNNIVVADYVPAGFEMVDTGWTMVGGIAYDTIPGPLAPSTSTIVSIDLRVKADAGIGSLINVAEIAEAKDTNGNPVIDEDSNLDNTPDNDGTPVDNIVNENRKQDPTADEDDHDFETVEILGNFDLSLQKIAASSSVKPGDNITYTISVKNEGDIDATDVKVKDNVPNGLTLIGDNFQIESGFAVLKTAIPSIKVGETKSVTITFKVSETFTGKIVNVAEISQAKDPEGKDITDTDSTPNNNEDGEDDQDDAEITVTPIDNNCNTITSITASIESICVGESSMVSAVSSNGSDIKWYLTPTLGTILFTTKSGEEFKVEPSTNIVYYAELATVTAANCPNVRLPLVVQVNARPLNPTCSESVDICSDEKISLNDYIINAVTTPGGTFEWRTGALSSSPLVADPASVGPGKYYLFEKSGAGCFSNPAILNVKAKACDKLIDIALLKTANKRIVERNDIVTYTITVENETPGAETAATNVKVQDVLPSGLTFVSSSTFTNTGGVLQATIPTIAVGQTITLTYQALVTGSGNIMNFAQVIAADQKDVDSSPGNGPLVNEDDDDDEVITVQGVEPLIDLSLQKFVSNSSPKLNDNLTYTIRVKNDGPDAATNVEVKDVMPASLQFVSVTGGDATSTSGGTVTASFNSIAVGQTVQFVVVAKVIGTGSVTNTAEVTKADQGDKDSTPGNGVETEDDFGKVTVTVQPEECKAVTPLIACANPYICSGESTSISAVGCNGTIVWSTGATGNLITVTPTVTTTYTAQCRVGECLSPTSNPVTVVVNSVAPPLVTASETTICSGSRTTLTATGCTGSILWSNGMVGSSIQVAPLTNTVYTAICKVATCESANSQPITITVGSTTVAPTIASTVSTICAGQQATLTAAGCTGIITWSTGATGNSITITPIATATYTAVCRVGSCTSPASTPLTITITSKETPTITASKEATCGGEAITLTAANCAGTITWSTGATGNSITVTPAATTTYTATCGTGVCAGTASKIITVGSGGIAPTITASANNVCAGSPVTLTAAGCTGGTITWNTGAAGSTLTVSPNATTTYTATCTTGVSCTGSQTITVNVKPRPNTPVVTCGKERICAGEALVFTGHNCDGIVTWSTGVTGKTMTVNPLVTTIYTATCTVDECVSLPSVPVTITVITETPTITAINETVCANGSTVLTAANCSGTYTWSTGANTVAITVSPAVTTTYSVT